MRWDNLFDDLESQLEQELSAEEVDLRAEEERLRLGRLSVRDRIVSVRDSYPRHADYGIRVDLVSGETIDVRPGTVGKDWFSGDLRDGSTAKRQCIVPLTAIVGVVLSRDQVRRSLDGAATDAVPTLPGRLTLPFVLRDLCRRRAPIEAVLPAGHLFGTIDRVGRDHFDLATHESGEPRREASVTQHRIVPLAQLVLVRV